MKAYVLSLAVGLLVGAIYGLLGVRSPAPPVVALVGLLGILIGEQVPTLAKTLWRKEPVAVSWLHRVQPHVFGSLPEGRNPPIDPRSGTTTGAQPPTSEVGS